MSRSRVVRVSETATPTSSTRQVLAVNLAEPREIEVRGKMVSTGIYKLPRPGRHRISRLGIEGDLRVDPRAQYGEANHAVYAYPYEHYAHWEDMLGEGSFPYGQFGENLTITGLLEDATRIGDVFRFGSAILQIAHPRIPCRKLNVRMGLKFARPFIESRRVGYYCRVLEEGEVEAGDAIELLERDPSSATMDEFVRLALFDYWDVEGLAYLLRAKDLAEEWRSSIESKIERARSAKGWHGRRPLRVVRRDEICDDVTSFYFECPDGRPLASFRGGQFLTVAIRLDQERDVVRRSYGISSSSYDASHYRITVQRRPPSRPGAPEGLSSHMTRALQVGDIVRVEAPRGIFTLDAATERCDGLLFITRQVSVASMLSMAEVWANEKRAWPLRIVCSVRQGGCRPLDDELQALRSLRPDLSIEYVEDPADDANGPEGAGLQGETLVRSVPTERGEIFLAGPNAFVDRIKNLLAELDFDPKRLHTERYG